MERGKAVALLFIAAGDCTAAAREEDEERRSRGEGVARQREKHGKGRETSLSHLSQDTHALTLPHTQPVMIINILVVVVVIIIITRAASLFSRLLLDSLSPHASSLERRSGIASLAPRSLDSPLLVTQPRDQRFDDSLTCRHTETRVRRQRSHHLCRVACVNRTPCLSFLLL